MTGELAVALGAVAGAPARYLLDRAVVARLGARLPLGTLAVNLAGSGAAGVLVGLGPSDLLGALLIVGFLGSFTTASTLAWDVLTQRPSRLAALLLGLHVLPGLLLAGLGVWIGRSL